MKSPEEKVAEAAQARQLKKEIRRIAADLGADLVGVAPVSRWKRYPIAEKPYHPGSIWPWSRSVIVMGLQIYLPMIETTPSIVYSELYNTTNRMLDELAYRVANQLYRRGHRAHFFPRDAYGDISVLVQKPEAAFSHVIAGYYAGLGTIGANHTLLTKQYGPRVRLVSVITDAPLPGDPMVKQELCISCGQCIRKCPVGAFAGEETEIIAGMNRHACAEYHPNLKQEFRYPCGRCVAVCPIGEDRKIYGASSVSPEGIEHCQNFGSLNAIQSL